MNVFGLLNCPKAMQPGIKRSDIPQFSGQGTL